MPTQWALSPLAFLSTESSMMFSVSFKMQTPVEIYLITGLVMPC